MKHLTNNDLILFAMGWQTLIEGVPQKKNHINRCKSCHQQMDWMNYWYNLHKQQNDHTCQIITDRIIQNFEQGDPDLLPLDIQRHLAQCDHCQLFYELYQSIPLIEQIEPAEQRLHSEIFAEMDQKIQLELERFSEHLRSSKFKNKLKAQVQATINAFEVVTRPVPVPGAIRGERKTDYHIFPHPGGELRLTTKLPGKKVKLYAIFHDRVYEEITDENGKVIFENIPEDDYRVTINGYEVSNINEVIAD